MVFVKHNQGQITLHSWGERQNGNKQRYVWFVNNKCGNAIIEVVCE